MQKTQQRIQKLCVIKPNSDHHSPRTSYNENDLHGSQKRAI